MRILPARAAASCRRCARPAPRARPNWSTTALPRLDALIAEGVTTIEIKSGYGLDTENELKMLRAARALGERRAIRVEPTFLGAHALPPEYRDDSDGYIDLVCRRNDPRRRAARRPRSTPFAKASAFRPRNARG